MHLLFVDLGRVGTEVRVDVESSCSSLGRIVRIAWCVEQGRSVGQLQTSPSTSMEVYVKRVKLWRDAREYRARKEYAKENRHDTVNSFEHAVYLFYSILRSSLPYFHDASSGNVRASAIFFLSSPGRKYFSSSSTISHNLISVHQINFASPLASRQNAAIAYG